MNPDRRAFLLAIFSMPDDPAPRLVYADWVEEHGNPAADLLRQPGLLICKNGTDGKPGTRFRWRLANGKEFRLARGDGTYPRCPCWNFAPPHTLTAAGRFVFYCPMHWAQHVREGCPFTMREGTPPWFDRLR